VEAKVINTPGGFDDTEPPTTLARTFAVRRDTDVEAFAAEVLALLDHGDTVIDLSRHDRRADVIELRVLRQRGGSQT
jgi:hypothetical protein